MRDERQGSKGITAVIKVKSLPKSSNRGFGFRLKN